MRSLSYLSLTRGVSVEKIQSSRSVSIRLTSIITYGAFYALRGEKMHESAAERFTFSFQLDC